METIEIRQVHKAISIFSYLRDIRRFLAVVTFFSSVSSFRPCWFNANRLHHFLKKMQFEFDQEPLSVCVFNRAVGNGCH